jgi:hypothetical protein
VDLVEWEGRPAGGVLFRGSDLLMIPFSLAWSIPVFLMFGSAASHGVTRSSSSLTFLPVAFVFITAAMYITVGRFAIDVWRRRSLRYVLTDRYAVIRGSFPWSQERRIDLTRVAEVTLRRGRGGRGTIEFGSNNVFGAWGRGLYGFGPAVPAFESISGVDTVYAKIRDIQNQGT